MVKQTVKSINLTEDFDQLLILWRACFPEDADFGKTFLKEAAPYAKIFGIYESGTLVSCAYCLPATFYDDAQQFMSYYIYGVGTLPEHRGKGYAKAILEYIKQVVPCDILFLYPAKPSLRAFYERLGYRSVLYRNEYTVQRSESMHSALMTLPFSAKEYTKKRAEFLQTKHIAYADFDSAILQVLLSHAKTISFDNGTALCIIDDGTAYFPEVLCDMLPTQCFTEKQSIVYMAGTEQESGMLLPCSMQAKKHFKRAQKIPFFGTFFAE